MEVPLTTTDTTNWSIQQIGCNVCKPKQEQRAEQERSQGRGYYDNEQNQLQPNNVVNKQTMGNNLLWIILALLILLLIGGLLMRKSGVKATNKKSRR